MDIAKIQKMPVGEKFGGGFTLTIKTAKKKTQVGEGWIHTVVFLDPTGEMLADVNIGKLKPLTRGQPIKIIVAEIQKAEVGTKMYVDQFERVGYIGEPPAADFEILQSDSVQVVRSKISCLLLAGKYGGGASDVQVLETSKSDIFKEIVDNTIKG